MTKFQQKIIALLIDLEMSKPGVISFIQAGIEYKLFKLKNDFKVCRLNFYILLIECEINANTIIII